MVSNRYKKKAAPREAALFFSFYDDCISCGACESECPVGAISMGDDHYQINADECISCGACAGVCPVGAPKEA